MTSPQSTSPFERFSPEDVRALIGDYPLAWVIAQGGSGEESTPLPLIGVYDADGQLVELIGHMARANPLHAALAADPRALILFQGPQSYVSPDQVGRRDWAPTWNYTQLRIRADITFEPERTADALDVLIDAVEGDRSAPWRAEELGARYDGLLAAIIGFRARLVSLRGKFKLGQDEAPADYRAIRATTRDPAMLHWMDRFNGSRGSAS
ncbi:FMN-binding negative transcriptional regulator [Sphingomonas sp. SRS2]|uniref:FMN-binding negative transcriptional regulator n=1 Tax=Sphingomonas sp. SRS2 TaxID=133190 RepID=UPI0006184BD8|nr:FMN-binding negative transcriptional regulator [Sphingomonas sp. SRS2]KKC27406.1 transcriptional regulator [Sphingomonas sp. SRS2]